MFDIKKYRKQLLIGAVSVCVLGAVGVGSYSYFSDAGTVVNEITTGSLDLDVSENEWDPTTDNDGKNLYPGYTAKKNPTIQNITGILDNNAYVRAIVTFKDKDGNPINNRERNDLINYTIRWDSSNALKEGTKYAKARFESMPTVNPAFKYVASKSNPDEGRYVYYLIDPLVSADTAGGGQSVTLFNTLVYPTEWSQTELDKMGDFKIDVTFEGIQEKTFEDVDDAMDALSKEPVIHKDYTRGDFNSTGATKNDGSGVNTHSDGDEAGTSSTTD